MMQSKHTTQTILLILLLFCLPLRQSAQETDPYVLIGKAQAGMDTIADYSASVNIAVYVSFVRIPPKDVTMYFKKPDKVKFTSDQFFILPKNSMGFSLNSLMEEEYTALFSGSDSIRKMPCSLVKVIPASTTTDVLLATLWISHKTHEIMKTEVTTRSSGSFTVEFWYNNETRPLPVLMEITFDTGKLTLPVKFLGFSQEEENGDNGKQKEGTGRIRLRFSGYKVNTGIEDGVFEGDE